MKFSSLKTKPKILIGICSPLILLVILGAVSGYSISSIVNTNRWVDHNRVVLAESAAIIGSAVDMETGMRGYLLAGKEGFLDPYKNGEKATYQRIASLKETVNDNPKQVERLEEVERILREWQEQAVAPTINLRRDIGDAETMNDMAQLVGEARDKVYFDAFRGQIQTFVDREAALLDTRRNDFQVAQTAVDSDFAIVLDTVGWTDHTHEVLASANQLLAHAVNMETGMRGFLLSGEEEFLDPYNDGQAGFFDTMTALQKTVDDNPAQVERLMETETIIRNWIEQVTEPAIALRRQVNSGEKTLQDVQALVSRKAGKQFFDSFRTGIAAFREVESSLLVQRQATAAEAEHSVEQNLTVMNENERWVTHTYGVIQEANAILAAAVDMETGMRGYLLAGREDFLAPYEAGSASFFDLSASLQETVNDNPAQVQLLTESQQTIRDWQANVTEPNIAPRRQIGSARTMDDMADLVGEARGKVYFDSFRQLMAEFSAEEVGLMDKRKADNEGTISTTFVIIAACVGLALMVGLALAWFIGNGIAHPIARMTEVMKKLAAGDKSVEISGTDRSDEIGDMAGAVQVFKDNAIEADSLREQQAEQERRAEEEKRHAMQELADSFEGSVKNVVQTLGSSASQMRPTAENMAAMAEETGRQSTAVATASEEATTNVQTVSAAAGEVTTSINEIGRRVAVSSTTAKEAVDEANKTNESVQSLSEAAQKIGDVVELINDIAGQTNLLALNATIEAARAGEAGKGFTVVASEVKNLATQTAKATEEIAAQISNIQSATKGSVDAIGSITSTIEKINELSTAIASAVEQQAAATREIANNCQQAASGTQEVSSNISGVQQSSNETGTAATEVLTAADGLIKQSDSLDKEVENFLSGVRAA